jgi:DNA-binding NarL/FixJ family response regulator
MSPWELRTRDSKGRAKYSVTGEYVYMSALVQSVNVADEIQPCENDPNPTAGHVVDDKNRARERILLLLDHRPLDGQCLAGCIAAHKIGMDAVWFSSMGEWRRKQAPRQFAAVLMNIGGKDVSDGSVAAEIKAITCATDAPIIVMSDSENLTDIIKALDLGARGYIPTSVSLDICIEAIALSMAGGIFVPASSVLAMRQQLHNDMNVVRPTNDFFTVRQGQVVEALRRGKANKIIAYELNMQESTVKVHIRSIMRKVKATNRTEVVYKVNDMFSREMHHTAGPTP